MTAPRPSSTRPHDFDLFVIGGGSGGVRAARVAANHGARVAIAEEHRYGGTCVIRGCIPKKLFVYAAHYGRDFADAAGFGWRTQGVAFDWPTLVANTKREIDRLSQIYERLLADAGVKVLAGRARLLGPHELVVTGAHGSERTFTAQTILVATGATPWLSGIPGAHLTMTSNEAFCLPRLPERIAIAGGGYIAVEFAHIFAGLGAKTLLVHRRDRVMRGFDEQLRGIMTEHLRDAGVELHMGRTIEAIEAIADGGRRRLTLDDGQHLEVDVVMRAVGRVPHTRGLGLEAAGVELNSRGGVVVDELGKTRVDHIYAVGDCTDRLQLTPVAIREGQAFADTVFGGCPTVVDRSLVPTAIFSQPTVASVGLSEEAARKAHPALEVYESSFKPLKHTLSGRDEQALIKVLVGARDRVVGVHMVGDGAEEIVQAAAIAMTAGATKADFDATVALHPSAAEELVLMKTPAR